MKPILPPTTNVFLNGPCRASIRHSPQLDGGYFSVLRLTSGGGTVEIYFDGLMSPADFLFSGPRLDQPDAESYAERREREKS